MRVKRLCAVVSILAICGFLLGGCANTPANQQNYGDYLTNSTKTYKQYLAALKAAPLVDIELPAPDGEKYHIVVNQEVKPQQVQQIKDDETLKFYGQLASVGLPVVGNVAQSWITNHYNTKNQEAMWTFFEQGVGDGQQIDSGGGDITLADSDFVTAKMTGTGNGFQALKGNQFAEGASGTANPSGAVEDNDTSSIAKTQSGGEDSNLIQ